MTLYTIVRKNNGTIVWGENQVRYIIDKYQNYNFSLKRLSDEFSCSPQAIRNLLRKNKIPLKGNKQGYPRNEKYFYAIDTPEKAYWLGFLYADGCVHSNNNEISVSLKDKEHLEKFKQALGATAHKITESKDNRFQKECIIYHFSIKDTQLKEDLIKWGCIPQKSLKLEYLPNIPINFVSHFLRGYFDGDGSLHYLKNTNNYRISFCGTKSFLEKIRHILQKDNLSICCQKDRVPQLQISGKKQVLKILDYLYEGSTEDTRLNRKYKAYLDCSEWAHSDWTS